MIAGAGFALMAWREAQRRACPEFFYGVPPVNIRRGCCDTCTEYYRLIDAAWDNRHFGRCLVVFAGKPEHHNYIIPLFNAETAVQRVKP